MSLLRISRATCRSFSTIPSKLTAEAHAAQFKKIPAWTYTPATADQAEGISRTFNFNDFKEAFGFMTKTALLAEEKCHHPEWFNVYNRVEVRLSTHDCQGLSMNDIEMAQAMDKFSGL